jgi:hypothetical protein
MKTDNIIADLAFGIIFLFLGFNILFRRKKIIDALMASNKVFWEQIGFTTDQSKGTFMSNIMIPFIGITFLIVSGILIYRVVIYFLK